MTRYELLDRIGVGGMAEIFRGKAVAAGGFEKPVAIKRILPHLSQDERFVHLLIAEAKVLSLLKHRNIVQIFDVGLGDDGQYFLVMEYVDGKDLGSVQKLIFDGPEAQRRRVPYDLVLHIGAEICEALEHAHASRGPDGRPMRLVHRDVSPSNVILSRAGEVKLTDFGIAKRADSETTRGSAVRGKFAYISPEQARNEHVDPRSDVFSVGILLWELLTNRRLFSGMGDLEALRGVREAQIAPPTSADPRLPKSIDAIVMTALARDPGRRYATAGALGAELRAMRYALDVTVGDPATELARIVEVVLETERKAAAPIGPSGEQTLFANEATVIRIQPAADFSGASGIAAARAVIDQFEDEETRLAQVSDVQLRALRSKDDSSPPRARRPSDEATRARDPLELGLDTPNAHVSPGDETKLVVPTRARGGTPGAQRTSRPPTSQPMNAPVEAPLTLDSPDAAGARSAAEWRRGGTLDEPPPQQQWGVAPTGSTNNREAPLVLDTEPRSVSARSVSARSVSARSVSAPSTSVPSASAPPLPRPPTPNAPMTLDGSTPPGLSEPLVPPQLPPQPPPPMMAPPPPMMAPPPPPMATPPPPPPAIATPPPGFAAWGPPMAAQQLPQAPSAPVAPPRPAAPPQRPSTPLVHPPAAHPPFATQTRPPRTGGYLATRPWLLAIGAVIVALVAFAITRALMS